MRVIAGRHRGRRLIGPVDEATTRPITDRVKTSLFDRLSAAGLIEGAVVADLFCGTGSMGIECLSRGAERVVFVERDRSAVERLNRNLETLGETERARVVRADVLGLGLTTARSAGPFDLVFVDPPYRMLTDAQDAARIGVLMKLLAEMTADDATMILRGPRDTAVRQPDGWAEPKQFNYGGMTLWHFGK